MDKLRESVPQNFQSYQDYWNQVLNPFYQSGRVVKLDSPIGGVKLHGVFYGHATAEKTKVIETVLIVPGRTEGSLKYTETCFDIYQQGFNVLVFGHRGQGFSERLLPDPQVGYVDRFDDYVADLDCWYRTACQLGSTDHPHIVAHSMGALICLKWLDEKHRSVSSVCFTAPMMKFDFAKIPECVVRTVVNLKCLLGFGKEFSVKPGELNTATYGEDLTTCRERLEWYRKVLSDSPELQLGYPSNHWLKVCLNEQACWSSARVSALFQKYVDVSFLAFFAEKDSVVKPRFFSQIECPVTNLRVQTLKSAFHDIFIETSSIRSQVSFELFKFWKEAKQKFEGEQRAS